MNQMNGRKLNSSPSWPTEVTDANEELTPKEEVAVATLAPTDAQRVKIEQVLEREAVVANHLPKKEQLAKFEKKLEHDDSGNQPS